MPISSDADVIRALLNGHWSPYVPYTPSAKQLAFCALPHMEALGGGAAGGGKRQPLSTKLPTPSGWTTNGELRVGDELFDEQGNICRVTRLFPTELSREQYTFIFDDGSRETSDAAHEWLTYSASELSSLSRRTPEFRKQRREKRSSVHVKQLVGLNTLTAPAGTVRTTAEIVATLRTPRGRANHAIPVTKSLNLPDADLPIDPYTLGLWLGDGFSASGKIGMLASDWEDIVGVPYEVTHTAFDAGGRTQPFRINSYKELSKLLKDAGLIKNKHIPSIYLRGSESQRLSLLKGLMDTDGTCNRAGSVEFSNTNKRIVDGVHELILSLGWKARVVEKVAKCNGKECGPVWNIKWTPDKHVFNLPRKARRQRLGTRRTLKFRYIVGFEVSKPELMRCIQVDSPSHLYLTGKSFIPTHNSAVLLMDALRYTDVPGYAAIIFRRSLTDLKRNGGLLDMAMQWLGPYIGKDLIYEPSTHMFKWFNGASLTFGYVGSYTAWEHYQGGNYQYIAWDELTQHSEQDYDEMFSRLRRNSCAIHGDFPQKGCPNCDLYAQLRSVPLRVRGACVDEGEVLTETGWKDIRLVEKGERVYSTSIDGVMELKEVEEVYKSFYSGPLTRIRKKNLYMSMTPDHKVVGITRGKHKQYTLTPFDEHPGTSIRIARAPLSYDNLTCGLLPTELAFLGLFLAEGSVGKPRKGNYKVIITQFNKHKLAPIKNLFDYLGYNWCYSKNGDFQITNKALWEKFSKFGKAHEKFVPREILQQANTQELTVLLDWLVLGDGHVRGNNITYVTCSPQLADDVMEIGVKLGYKTQYDHHTLPNDKHHDRYTVYLTKSKSPTTLVDKGWSRNDVRQEDYEGYVYCLKVKDNANFVLRQRGKIWLSGNTNPGGRGHLWVKKRFKLYKSKDPKLINPVTKQPGIWVSGEPSKPFIPWFFVDNPGLDQETYDQTLRMIRDDQRKAQLLEGDWDWIANGVFRPEWFAPRYEYQGGYYCMLSPSTGIRTHSYHEKELRIFMVVDVACSVREGVGERSFKQTQGGQLPASWTVMGVFGVTPKSELLILDVKRFQQEAPTIFDEMRALCQKWRPMYVALEVNGPGKPIAQQALQYGIPLKEVISFVDKPSNSAEAQIRCRSGKVILPREDSTTWQNDLLGELTTWTGHPHEPDDQVDVISNAVHEFTRLCGNPDRDTTLKSHARDLPFISKKHGKIFDYPTGIDLMGWH